MVCITLLYSTFDNCKTTNCLYEYLKCTHITAIAVASISLRVSLYCYKSAQRVPTPREINVDTLVSI